MELTQAALQLCREVPWSSPRFTQPQNQAVIQELTSPPAIQCSVHAVPEARTPEKHGQQGQHASVLQAKECDAKPGVMGARQLSLNTARSEGLIEHPVEPQYPSSRDSACLAQEAVEASQPGISARQTAAEEQHPPQKLPHAVAGKLPPSAQQTAASDYSSLMLTTENQKQMQESSPQHNDSEPGRDVPTKAAAHSSPIRKSTSGLANTPADASLDVATDTNSMHSPTGAAGSSEPQAEQDAVPSSAPMASIAVTAEGKKPRAHDSPIEAAHCGSAASDFPELQAGRSLESLPEEENLAIPHAVESDCTATSAWPDHAGKEAAHAEMYGSRPTEPDALLIAAAPASQPVAAASDTRESEVERHSAPEHTGPSSAEGATAAVAAAEEAASAEDEHATRAELLALASAVTQLEAELADSRQAAAGSQKEAQAAREEAAQWQDREADARAQVQAPDCIFLPYKH